jgi:phosphate ABC transporter phosphate-binding protein
MRTSQRAYIGGVPLLRGILVALLICFCCAARSQVTSLSQVKTLYVDSFPGGSGATLFHDSLVRRLTKNGRFVLVPSAQGADAVLTGTGQIWIRGYITINPRNPASDRQAVYGGYLSLEAVSADGKPLWSWLVTPNKLTWTNFVDDLAGRGAEKLIAASKAASATADASGSPSAHAQTTLTGAGATFPAPLYQKWFQNFEQAHPGTYVQYLPLGSQRGIQSLIAGKLDFAGSDVAPELVLNAVTTSHLRRFATVLGAVVPIYNIKGLTQDLRFTPEVLADIYLGKLRHWSDPEIRRSNKGVNLPDEQIVVIHRSEGSGTTWIWSDYLSKVSPAWTSAVGRGATLRWPEGRGAEGNEGVAEAVENTPNAIGYVELAYAIQHDLSYGAVRNRAHEFIHADLDNLAEAARTAGVAGEAAPSITDSDGKYAYPIATFTWIVIPTEIADALKKAAITDLLRWVLTDGQKECSAFGYAPLPHDVAVSQLRTVDGSSAVSSAK